MIEARALFPPRWIYVSTGIGAYAALVASAPSLTKASVLTAPLALGAFAWWMLAERHRWIGAFIAAALLLPPLPIPLGNSGPHPSLAFAALGLFAGVAYLRDWHLEADYLSRAFLCLFAVLLVSVVFAALYSGIDLAVESLARVLLFGIGVYLFFYAAYVVPSRGAPRVHLLYGTAAASALIACVDFYYQLPAPAGFGPQFVWLETGVYRRAQGIFYEASTLGNFCAFFLVMIAVALTRPRKQAPLSRPALVVGGVLFSAALIFSYSRASILNVAAALVALGWLHRARVHWRRVIPLLTVSIAAGALSAYYFLPAFFESFWLRLSGSALYFFDYTEGVFSGRFDSWRVLLSFLTAHPGHAIFGVGYKTLPYSDYIGQTVIADNMYLSMLVETGVIGLAALVALNFAILRAARRAARHASPNAAFYGTWIFCFWVGQSFQMLSSDLLTYWRVLPVYFLVLAWAVRESKQAPAQ
jgi:O-antigen ligase